MTDFNTDRQTLLDLLVDGELDEGQRRELLAWCEREPDGWRRCALAFLEAQSWSKVLGDLTTHEAVPPAFATKSIDVVRPARRTLGNLRKWGTMLAMAASVVFAFTLGVWVRDAGKAGQMAPAGQPPLNVVGNGQNTNPAGSGSGLPEQGLNSDARLAVGGQSRAADAIQVPVAAGDELDGGWVLTQPSAMPDDVRRALERLGHRVQQQRRLVPYRLGDGRRVVVPVDQVEVRPVDNQSYQ